MYYKVKLRVKSVKGDCAAGHKEGDVIVYEDPCVCVQNGGKICLYALSAFVPYLTAYGRETASDDWVNSLTQLQCPDATNTVLFAVERSE